MIFPFGPPLNNAENSSSTFVNFQVLNFLHLFSLFLKVLKILSLFLLSPPTFQVREEKEEELKVILADAQEQQRKEDRYFEAEYSAKKAELEFKNALYKYSRVKYNHKRDVTVQRNFLQPR